MKSIPRIRHLTTNLVMGDGIVPKIKKVKLEFSAALSPRNMNPSPSLPSQTPSPSSYSLSFFLVPFPCTHCKSAQWCTTIGGSLYHAPKLHPGPCSSVGVRPRRDRQTDRQTHTHTHTQTRVTTIYFASSTTHAKCNKYTQSMVNKRLITRSMVPAWFYFICLFLGPSIT